jgi:hypothetical protein
MKPLLNLKLDLEKYQAIILNEKGSNEKTHTEFFKLNLTGLDI